MHPSDTSGPSPNQNVQTPGDLLDAIEYRFGKIDWDLAAESDAVAVADRFITPEQDSLSVAWPHHGHLFLNPPFNDIAPWAAKCRDWVRYAESGSRLTFLVPASIDSNWWCESVAGTARLVPLRQRVKFLGHAQGFPKPIALCIYEPTWPTNPPVENSWSWRRKFKVGSLIRTMGCTLRVLEDRGFTGRRNRQVLLCGDTNPEGLQDIVVDANLARPIESNEEDVWAQH